MRALSWCFGVASYNFDRGEWLLFIGVTRFKGNDEPSNTAQPSGLTKVTAYGLTVK